MPSILFPYVLIDPFPDQLGNLVTVLVVHQHVAIAENAQRWRIQHLSIATRSINPNDKGLAVVELILPI